MKLVSDSPIKVLNNIHAQSPDLCSLAQDGNSKPYGRLHVNLDESNELGTFIFRTAGFLTASRLWQPSQLLLCSFQWLAVLFATAIDLTWGSDKSKLSNPCVLC